MTPVSPHTTIPSNLKSLLPQPKTPWNVSSPLFERVSQQPWITSSEGKLLYKKCELTPDDPECAFLLRYFNHQKPAGFGISRIYCIHNPSLTNSFQDQVDLIDKEADTFKPEWDKEDNKAAREAVIERWKSQVNQFYPISIQKPTREDTYFNVRVLPLWHGTSPSVCHSVASTGFNFFGKHHFFSPDAKAGVFKNTDPGYFGSGVYLTNSAQYAAMYKGGALLLAWVAMKEPFPVINDVPHPHKGKDMRKLEGHGTYQTYNAHYIPVAPISPDPRCMQYFPCYHNQAPVCDEFVFSQKAHIVPRFWIELVVDFPATLSVHPLVPGSFVIDAGALPISAGLSLLAKCSSGRCSDSEKQHWIPLGIGNFNMTEVYCSTPCPTCKVDFDAIDYFLLHKTTYSLQGRRKDRSLIQVEDQALSPDQSLMISHFADWKYLNITLK
mgnify:CR=1 FL=1